MKYNISIDSGGSSTVAVIYENGLRKVGVVRTGSVRANTTSAELITRHIGELVDGLKEYGLTEVGVLGGLCPGSIMEALEREFAIGQRLCSSEFELGRSAALIDSDAVLILCGTGCSYFSHINGHVKAWGGYGAAVGDFGSGYDIGRRALEFAIADYEGRGNHTALTGMICQRFDRSNLNAAIFSIYRDGFPLSPAAAVASIKPIVDQAAEIGDVAAISVLKDTGRIVGERLLAFYRAFELPADIPATVSGGVWKGHRTYADAMLAAVRKQMPDFGIIEPVFEPVIGAMLRDNHLLRENAVPDKTLKFLLAEYEEFKIKPNPAFR